MRNKKWKHIVFIVRKHHRVDKKTKHPTGPSRMRFSNDFRVTNLHRGGWRFSGETQSISGQWGQRPWEKHSGESWNVVTSVNQIQWNNGWQSWSTWNSNTDQGCWKKPTWNTNSERRLWWYYGMTPLGNASSDVDLPKHIHWEVLKGNMWILQIRLQNLMMVYRKKNCWYQCGCVIVQYTIQSKRTTARVYTSHHIPSRPITYHTTPNLQ